MLGCPPRPARRADARSPDIRRDHEEADQRSEACRARDAGRARRPFAGPGAPAGRERHRPIRSGVPRRAEGRGDLGRRCRARARPCGKCWVAKSHSAQSGLFYVPHTETEVYLAATANGQAWLASLGDEQLRAVVEKQGLHRAGLGPNAPSTMEQLLSQIERTRELGYACVTEAYELGTSAMATAIRKRGVGRPVGTVSVAGPTIRMTSARMAEIAPWLLASADELGAAAASSPLFSLSSDR